MGQLYSTGSGVDQDYTKAVFWYRKAAKQHDGKAQDRLGGMYAEGKGVTKNLVQAYAWLAVAIDNGNKESGRLQKK